MGSGASFENICDEEYDRFRGSPLFEWFICIGCAESAALINCYRCSLVDIYQVEALLEKLSNDISLINRLILNESQRDYLILRLETSLKSMSIFQELPVDILETLDQAYNMSLQLPPLDSKFLSHRSNHESESVQIVSTWSLPLSSNQLYFSDDKQSVWRNGKIGSFPKALILATALVTQVSVRMDRSCTCDDVLSVGICRLRSFDSNSFCLFGKERDSWGFFNYRGNRHASIEFWDDTHNVMSFERNICEGDIFSLILDLVVGKIDFLLNGALLYSMSELPRQEQYVVGLTVPVDHCFSLLTDSQLLSMPLSISEDSNLEYDVEYRNNSMVTINDRSSLNHDTNNQRFHEGVDLDADGIEHIASLHSLERFDSSQDNDNLDDDYNIDDQSNHYPSQVNHSIHLDDVMNSFSSTIPVPSTFPRQLNILSKPPTSSSTLMLANLSSNTVGMPSASSIPTDTLNFVNVVNNPYLNVDISSNSSLSTPQISNPSPTVSQVSDLCCVCLALSKCIVLLPCRHMCLCEKCGSNTSKILSCPICRHEIVSRLQVFT